MSKNPPQRPPDWGFNYEKCLLGAVLDGHSDRVAELINVLVVGDFGSPIHGTIWMAIARVCRAGEPINIITVHESIRAHGSEESISFEDLIALTKNDFAFYKLDIYIAGIQRASQRRQLLAEVEGVAQRLRDDVMLGDGAEWDQYAESTTARLIQVAKSGRPRKIVSIRKAVDAVAARWREQIEGRSLAMSTGFPTLNRLCGGGLWPGRLYIIAGRPGQGKTTAGASITRTLTLARAPGSPPRWQPRTDATPVLWASGEMEAADLTGRMLSDLASIDTRVIESPSPDWLRNNRDFVTPAMDLLASTPIEFVDDDDSGSLEAIEAAAWSTRARLGHGVPFVLIIDYLQRLEMNRQSKNSKMQREEIVSLMAKRCKTLARQVGCAVVLMAQLNRDLEKRKPDERRPQLSDLRESGAIEQEADVVFGLYRDFYYHDDKDKVTERLAELNDVLGRGFTLAETEHTERDSLDLLVHGGEMIVLKNRRGPLGTIYLDFYGQFARYAEREAA